MITYTVVAEGAATRDPSITEHKLMEICTDCGVLDYPSGAFIECLNREIAEIVVQRLISHGIKVLAGPIEADNPNYVERPDWKEGVWSDGKQ